MRLPDGCFLKPYTVKWFRFWAPVWVIAFAMGCVVGKLLLWKV